MKTTLLIILVFITTFCFGQADTIKDTRIIFKKPNSNWHLKNIEKTDSYTTYWFKREPIADKEGRNIIPNINFVLQSVPDSTDVITFSMVQRSKNSFKVDSIFTSGDKHPRIKLKDGLVFLGRYTYQNLEHTIYVVYLVRKNLGITIVMDMTTELFYTGYRKEFDSGLKSLREY